MIKSMTGYGKGEAIFVQKKITVEIRSLNSKQLDLAVKMPSIYRQSEYDIRNMASKRLQRGKADIYVSYEIAGSNSTVMINREAFGSYLNQIKEIATANYLDWGSNVMSSAAIMSILKMPEVMQNETVNISEDELCALKKAVEGALDNMDSFREQEGSILIADMLSRIDKIEKLKNSVAPYEKMRTENIKARIRENIDSMGLSIDNNRLEQEMIYYIEKLDITEEKVRLQSHCNYFREVAHSEDNVGRKLGFISQEIGREINTLGSKSNEAAMQKMVVEMKDELEKIKEQLLNIL